MYILGRSQDGKIGPGSWRRVGILALGPKTVLLLQLSRANSCHWAHHTTYRTPSPRSHAMVRFAPPVLSLSSYGSLPASYGGEHGRFAGQIKASSPVCNSRPAARRVLVLAHSHRLKPNCGDSTCCNDLYLHNIGCLALNTNLFQCRQTNGSAAAAIFPFRSSPAGKLRPPSTLP